ncbi:MAG: hypothetical protein Q7R73_01240 [bacterium]|nr:hypothetical protein [bacterium]
MKEITKKIVELHHALYRVTDLLPPREPLRKMLRESANILLTYIVGECLPAQAGGEKSAENVEFRINIRVKIEAVQSALSVAKDAGYCHPVNFEVLQREYTEIVRYFETKPEIKKEEKSQEKQVPAVVQSEPLIKKEDDFVRVFEGGPVPDKKQDELKPVFQVNGIKFNTNSDPSFNERQQAIVDFIKERKEVKSTDLATIFSNRFSLKTLQRDLVALIQNKVIEKEGEKRWAVYRMNGYH